VIEGTAQLDLRSDAFVAGDLGDLEAAAESLSADLEALAVRQRVRSLLAQRVEAHRPALAEPAEASERQARQREIRAARIFLEVECGETAAQRVETFHYVQAHEVLRASLLAPAPPRAHGEHAQPLVAQPFARAQDLEIVDVERGREHEVRALESRKRPRERDRGAISQVVVVAIDNFVRIRARAKAAERKSAAGGADADVGEQTNAMVFVVVGGAAKRRAEIRPSAEQPIEHDLPEHEDGPGLVGAAVAQAHDARRAI